MANGDKVLGLTAGVETLQSIEDNTIPCGTAADAVALYECVTTDLSTANRVVLADRDTAAGRPPIGFVSKIVDSTNCIITTTGGRVSGFTGLTQHDVYYLSSTPGAITNSKPSSNAYIVGIALSTTDMLVCCLPTDVDNVAAHDLGGSEHNADTLANLNAKISDASVVALAGQIGGTAASPDVRGIRETDGPTTLTIGAILDTQTLVRSGSALVGRGAVPTYVVGSVSELTSALSAASAGDTIFMLPGTYTITSTLRVPTGVYLQGSGVGQTIIYTTSATYLVRAYGSWSSDYNLDTNAQWDSTLDLNPGSNANLFSEGDLVWLYDDASGGTSIPREQVSLATADGSNPEIYVSPQTFQTYAGNGTVARMAAPVWGVRISDMTIRGDGGSKVGLDLYGCVEPRVWNVRVEDCQGGSAVWVRRCLNPHVEVSMDNCTRFYLEGGTTGGHITLTGSPGSASTQALYMRRCQGIHVKLTSYELCNYGIYIYESTSACIIHAMISDGTTAGIYIADRINGQNSIFYSVQNVGTAVTDLGTDNYIVGT